MPLLDTDAVIEEHHGISIPEIFRSKGESYFRNQETALLRYLLENPISPPSIISTGGGIVLKRENRSLLRRLGFVVWLNVSVNTLLIRTSYSNNRPLLQNGNRREILQNLHNERRPLYRRTAHYRLDSSRMDVNTITMHVCNQAERYFHYKNPIQGLM